MKKKKNMQGQLQDNTETHEREHKKLNAGCLQVREKSREEGCMAKKAAYYKLLLSKIIMWMKTV